MNLVAAGPVSTPAAGGIPGFERLAALWGSQAPLGWDPEDPAPVADAVCFLLSDLSRGGRRARSSTWTAASTRWALRSRPSDNRADAPRDRRRQHPDPRGDVRRRTSWWSTGASPPCASRPRTSWPAGVSSLLGLRELAAPRRGRGDRLVGRAVARARVRPADRALPRRQRGARGPVAADGDADPDRQPARAGRRPAGERGGGLRPRGRGVHRGRLRHGDQLRRRVRATASTWAA